MQDVDTECYCWWCTTSGSVLGHSLQKVKLDHHYRHQGWSLKWAMSFDQGVIISIMNNSPLFSRLMTSNNLIWHQIWTFFLANATPSITFKTKGCFFPGCGLWRLPKMDLWASVTGGWLVANANLQKIVNTPSKYWASLSIACIVRDVLFYPALINTILVPCTYSSMITPVDRKYNVVGSHDMPMFCLWSREAGKWMKQLIVVRHAGALRKTAMFEKGRLNVSPSTFWAKNVCRWNQPSTCSRNEWMSEWMDGDWSRDPLSVLPERHGGGMNWTFRPV